MNAAEFESNCKRGRFAPSTTGRVHPGTLVAALLCWLDAKSSGAEVVLRLEDLDTSRTKPGYVEAMERDLEWFGLDWDARELQSDRHAEHDATIAELVAQGRVYACRCSRADIRAAGVTAPDGSVRYPGTCRAATVSRESWRDVDRTLRIRLEGGDFELVDESGLDLSGDAAELFGDPILRRRDGVHAYHFASIIDDGLSEVTRIVRGRDLAPSTILQEALRQAIGIATPTYRHHLLLMERTGRKLSKLHGAVDVEALRAKYDAEALCGLLAGVVGLVPEGTACRPADLVESFAWRRVREDDVELRWDAERGVLIEVRSTIGA